MAVWVLIMQTFIYKAIKLTWTHFMFPQTRLFRIKRSNYCFVQLSSLSRCFPFQHHNFITDSAYRKGGPCIEYTQGPKSISVGCVTRYYKVVKLITYFIFWNSTRFLQRILIIAPWLLFSFLRPKILVCKQEMAGVMRGKMKHVIFVHP